MEVRQLASQQHITVMNGVSGGMLRLGNCNSSEIVLLSVVFSLFGCFQQTYKPLLFLLRHWELSDMVICGGR